MITTTNVRVKNLRVGTACTVVCVVLGCSGLLAQTPVTQTSLPIGNIEIVNHEVTGLLFRKDDVNSLTDALELGINDSSLRNKLGKQARKWVKEERDWPILAKKITNLYDSLTNKTG